MAQSAITDATGRYTIPNLQRGAYTVTFTLPGFATMTRRPIDVTATRGATVDAVLRPAPLAESQVRPFAPPFRRGPRPDARGAACLHGENEAPEEAARREEALAAARLIFQVLDMVWPKGFGLSTPPPTWESFATAPGIERLKKAPGQTGELASRIAWGTSEPLPGWGIAYVANPTDIRLALVDLRDPCGFSYSSLDPDVGGGTARIVPLT
jgi:hypothetical protein